MKRYFQAPISTGPAKSAPPKTITKEESPADMEEVVIIPTSRRQKKGKNERLKYKEGETTQEGKDRRAENKQNRREARREKTAGKIEKAKKAAVESGKKSGMSDETKRQTAKAKRLEKKQKRQESRDEKRSKRKEGRAERKNIRKKAKEGKIVEGKSGEYNALSKKEKIKKSRKDQKRKS